VLSITFSADVTILPFVGRGLYENAATADKTYVEIDADHFAFKAEEPRDAGIPETAEAIVEWLKARFPSAA
jgi:hypothetical protein